MKKPNSKLTEVREAVRGIADHHRVNTAVEKLLAVIVEQDVRIAKLEKTIKQMCKEKESSR